MEHAALDPAPANAAVAVLVLDSPLALLDSLTPDAAKQFQKFLETGLKTGSAPWP